MWIDHPGLMLARKERRDADVGQRRPEDDSTRPKFVRAHPGAESEALVCGSIESLQRRVVLDLQASLARQVVGHPGVVEDVRGLHSLGAVVDGVERKVGAGEDLQLQCQVWV